MSTLSPSALEAALSIRDLTDPSQGPHAMQLLLDDGLRALGALWGLPVQTHRAHPVVSVADNYDHLGYPPDCAARDARYSRYVDERTLLRTQTSAMIPPLLRAMAPSPRDAALACPGVVYRRDSIDRLHTGEPHQVDLWRIYTNKEAARADLMAMIGALLGATLPGRGWRAAPAEHPYTEQGLQIDVSEGGSWVEVGECGLASRSLLGRCGLPGATGLALGLGLDRVLMLRKGIDDIRLLRSREPRVQAQLLDLLPWRPVSWMPPVHRDLSIACEAGAGAEELGDRVRSALGDDATLVEAVAVLSQTPGEALPAAARARIGMKEGQQNALLRVTLRALDRTLTDAECNELRDRVYGALHQGTAHQWAAR